MTVTRRSCDLRAMGCKTGLLSADDVRGPFAEETGVGEPNQFYCILQHLTLAANIVRPAETLRV